MKTSLLLFLSGSMAFPSCLPVTSDRITGRDLAMAEPRFAALPATLTIGFAPVPGMKRTFAVAELERIARANGIAVLNPQESCFEIPLRKVTKEEVVRAMRSSLPANAEVSIVELSAADVPVGDLEFSTFGLEPPVAGGIQTWHGSVRFTSTRKAPVWARVTISQKFELVVSDKDLAANVPVGAATLRASTWSGPLIREKVAVGMEDVLGRVPRRGIKAGAPIPLAILEDAPTVRRGDSIRVEVNSGPARLILHAIAEKDSHDGDYVELRNPITGRTFRARLEGSKAVVVVEAGGGL